MFKDHLLWQFIENKLLHQQSVMLLLVAESSGSSPGRPGFKMAISEDLSFEGSIGGGIMEVKLVELAKEMLGEKNSATKIKKQIHRKNIPRDQSGMICSGEQTVIYFSLRQHHLPEIKKIMGVLSGNEFARITYAHDDQHDSLLLDKNVVSSGEFEFTKSGESSFTFNEWIGYKHHLFIVGGGHCSLALSELMARLDFYIHVIDDRPELKTMQENSFAHVQHVVKDYMFIADIIPSGQYVYVVIMTVGYRSDLVVMQTLALKTFGYFGLMGSETKVNTLKAEFLKAGYPEPFLNLMHAPIGIKIDSHTPEEIAVSIAAEIISVKNRNAIVQSADTINHNSH